MFSFQNRLVLWGLGAWLAASGLAGAQLSQGNLDGDGAVVPVFPKPTGSVAIANSGEATVAIPLPTPPGVHDMAPDLALSYSSARGDEGLGTGWRLSLGRPVAIERTTRFGIPSYDARDAYTFDGQDLVRVGREYRTKVDTFRRIFFIGNRWVVLERDGTRLEYGTTADSRNVVPGKGIYRWHLDRVLDPVGNSIELDYGGSEDNRRLERIRYTLTTSGQPIGQLQEVILHWETRPDPKTSAIYGAPVRWDDRLESMETKTSGNLVRSFELCYADESCGASPVPIKGNSLLAALRETAADGTALPAREFLYQEPGPGWADQDAGFHSPFLFAWHYQDPDRGRLWVVFDFGVRLADVNGDGWVDIIDGSYPTFENKKYGEVYLHNGKTGWSRSSTWRVPYLFVNPDSNGTLSDVGMRILDVNGDGLPDLLHSNRSTREIWMNTGRGWGASNSGYHFPTIPGEPEAFAFVHFMGLPGVINGGTALADLNGDGLPDLLWAREGWPARVYLNNGKDGWVPAPAGAWEIPWMLARYEGEDNGVQLVDVNGDGLADITRSYFEFRQIREIRLNHGSGWETTPSWQFPADYPVKHHGARFVDVDADGYNDIVLGQACCEGQVYLNNQSDGFVLAPDWNVPLPLEAWGPGWDNGVRIVDVNGDGAADLLHAKLSEGIEGNKLVPRPIASTHLARGGRSDLLVRYTNSVGGDSTIAYGQASGLGLTPGRMPFFRTVVQELAEDGRMGDPPVTTSYEYDNGLYDRDTKTFMGYQRVVDTRADASRRERTFYLSWNDDGEILPDHGRKGLVRVEELVDADSLGTVNDDKVYLRRDNTYSGGSPDRYGVYRPRLTREEVTQFHQDSRRSLVFRRTDYTYDAFGNVSTQRERDWGTTKTVCDKDLDPRSRSLAMKLSVAMRAEEEPRDCYDQRVAGPVRRSTRTTYAVNQGRWIVNRPATIERYAGNFEALLSVEERRYDGLGLGQVSRGLLTEKKLRDPRLEGRLLYGSESGVGGPVNPGSSLIVTTYEHDAYGNVVTERNGRRFSTHVDYEPNGFLFPYTVRRDNPGRPLIQQTTLYHRGLGVLLQETDFNGNTTHYTYDGLGRLTAIRRPDDPAGDPSLRVTRYELGTLPAYMEVAERLDRYRTRVRRDYFDGLGRPLANVSGANVQWTVAQLTRYDARGRVEKIYEPFIRATRSLPSAGNEDRVTTYRYEDDKVSTVTYPGGAASTNTYTADEMWHRDENGHVIVTRFDAFENPVEVRNPIGTTSYLYDGLGRLARVTDPRGLVTESFYDARGNLRGISPPDGTQPLRNGFKIWNDYDEQGNHTYRWSGMDVWRAHYDGLDRQIFLYLSRDQGSSFKAESRWYYDYGANARGRLYYIIGYGPPVTWNLLQYDVRGRVTQEYFGFRGLDTAAGTSTIAYHYDRQDALTASRDPRGRWTETPRDYLGRVQSVQYDGRDAIYHVDYEPSGQPSSVHYAHRVMDVFDYDARGRMTSIMGSGPLQIEYEYDRAGNLLSEDTLGSSRVSVHYEYDAANRLIGASGHMGAASLGLTYSYDTSGNLRSVSGTGALAVSYNYPSSNNRLYSFRVGGRPPISAQYDVHGNLTRVNDMTGAYSRTYTYDALNRLRSYQTATASGDIVYDGRGRKVRRTLPGGDSEIYFHDVTGDVVATLERNAGGAEWTTYLTSDGRRFGYIDPEDEMFFIHSDRLGSARAITVNAGDPSRRCLDCESIPGKCIPVSCPPEYAVIWKADYLPFGKEINASGNGDNFRFTGQELQGDVGLYDYGARYYDPLLRRFLQADSFLGAPEDPRTLNRYSYALNNPVGYVDPTGNVACSFDDPFCDFTTTAADATATSNDDIDEDSLPVYWAPEIVVEAPRYVFDFSFRAELAAELVQGYLRSDPLDRSYSVAVQSIVDLRETLAAQAEKDLHDGKTFAHPGVRERWLLQRQLESLQVQLNHRYLTRFKEKFGRIGRTIEGVRKMLQLAGAVSNPGGNPRNMRAPDPGFKQTNELVIDP